MKKKLPSHPDYYELGNVRRTHGVRGDVIVFLDTDEPQRYKKLQKVWVEKGEDLREFKVNKVSVQEKDKTAILHLEGIEDIPAAEELQWARLFLPLSSLPKLKGKQFYFHEILGYKVTDETEGDIGTLINIYDLQQHPVGEVIWNGKQVLFPLIEEFISEINRDEKILKMKLPDGMLDVYR